VKLYTGHWGNKELADLDAVMVAISRGKPRWKLPYRYRVLGLLVPSKEAFTLQDWQEFERAYRAGLEEVGVERIVSELRRINYEHGGKPLVCLCWEPPGQFCHRRVFARWIEEHTGVGVSELRIGMAPRLLPPNQEKLF